MAETQTHKTTRLLVDLANGEAREKILDARRFTMGQDLFIRADEENVGVIIGKIAGHVLDQVIRGSVSIVYGEHVSALGLAREGRGYGFRKFDTTTSFKPLPGLDLGNETANDIQVAYRIFEHLVSGESIDSGRVGQCYCGRYFLSIRTGKRKSRACSKAHQAVACARKLRESPAYLQRERDRNTERMRLVREAEKLVRKWVGEGMTARECERLLHVWNDRKGSVLGKRAFFNLLEKISGTPGTQTEKKSVPD